METIRARRHSSDFIDRVLGDALRGASLHNARAAALSVTHSGLHAGFHDEDIRQFLVRCPASEHFAPFASTRDRFRPVLRQAIDRRTASSSPEGRDGLKQGAAVALVGYLFSPPPKSKTTTDLVSVPKTVLTADGTEIETSELVEKKGLTSAQLAGARRITAVVGADVLRSLHAKGWDSTLVNQLELAVRLGITPSTVRNYMKWAVQAGWLSKRTPWRSVPRYGIRGIATPKPGNEFKMKLPAGIRDTSWNFVRTVNALAELDEGADPVADLILLADHAAWGHAPTPGPGAPIGSRRDGKVWLTALAGEAEVDPTTLGVSALAAKQGAAAWLRINFGHDTEASLQAVLDADARATGADLAVVDARAKRAAAIAARNASLDEARRRSEQADKGATALLAKHPAPALSENKETRRQWLVAMTERVNASAYMDDAMRRALEKVLVRKLVAKPSLYDRPTAVVVAGRIAGRLALAPTASCLHPWPPAASATPPVLLGGSGGLAPAPRAV